MNMLILLDSGHGGLINNIYQTEGKRSPLWPNNTQLFEGVFNRKIVAKIKKLLDENDIKYLDVVDSEEDVPLKTRVDRANKVYKTNPNCVYISVHGNAGPEAANGLEVFTSKGQTKSDILASLLIDELESILPNVKFRKDNTDGDEDKEENFYVLRETNMPAVLSENGFMTNFNECQLMLTDDYQNKIAQAHVNAILKYIKTQK